MYRLGEVLVVPRAEALGDDYGGAARQADKEAHQQIDQCAGGAADGGQSHLADVFADDHGVDGVIELLEEGAH